MVGQCANPIVVYWLISGDHDRVSLPRKDRQPVNFSWHDLDAVSLDDRHPMAVDGEVMPCVTRCANDTEAIAFAVFHVDNRKRCFRTSRIASFPIDGSRIGSEGRYDPARGHMPPMHVLCNGNPQKSHGGLTSPQV